MNRAQLKSMAKEQIKGNIGTLFIVSIIVALISIGVSFVPFIGSIAGLFLTPAFALSCVTIYLNLTKGNKPVVGDTFIGFNDLWSAFKVNFLSSLYILLWMLLLIVPGIIKSFSYFFAMYILAENPGKSARECIAESKAMTEGHKMDLFVLGLSFIGWILLAYVTFGIALIWVYPYMQATFANAYNSLRKPAAYEIPQI